MINRYIDAYTVIYIFYFYQNTYNKEKTGIFQLDYIQNF